MSKDFKLFIKIYIIFITIITELYLYGAFPYTGLGRILTIPFSFLWAVILIIILTNLLNDLKNKYIRVILIISFGVATYLSAIIFWPQDGGPSTWEQVFDGKKRN